MKRSWINIHTHRPAHSDEWAFFSLPLGSVPVLCAGTFYAVGVHPWDVKEAGQMHGDRFMEKVACPQVVLIGECGLDRCIATSLEVQKEVFLQQVQVAEVCQKPVLVHCVRAFDVLMQIRKNVKPRQPWIIHGFRGKPELMHQLLRSGFLVSFGVHFHDESVRSCPSGSFFIETDESPEPIASLYNQIARLRQTSVTELLEEQYQSVRQHLKLDLLVDEAP